MRSESTKRAVMPEQYWTIKEVALRLRVTEDCIRKWLTRGVLKFKKAGTRTLIPETNVQAFLEECTRKATSSAG